MLFFYIRHGDPIYDPDSLTPLGHRQAEAIGKRLALYGLDKVYASTSNRAILTSKPACEILKKEPTLLEFANEHNAWQELVIDDAEGRRRWLFDENLPTKMLFHSPEVRQLGFRWFDHPQLNEPRFEQGMERIYNGCDELFASLGYEHERYSGRYKAVAPNHDRVALFAHQGFGLAFMSCLLDIPYPMFATEFDMTHTGMTVIEFMEKDGYAIPKVLTFSSDAHIYREGLPTNYNNQIRF